MWAVEAAGRQGGGLSLTFLLAWAAETGFAPTRSASQMPVDPAAAAAAVGESWSRAAQTSHARSLMARQIVWEREREPKSAAEIWSGRPQARCRGWQLVEACPRPSSLLRASPRSSWSVSWSSLVLDQEGEARLAAEV